MQQNHKREILGVLGGMGPLASAEFLKTIYEYNLLGEREQESPKVVVYSDPTFPDRTEVLLNGNYHFFLEQLIKALSDLCKLDVSTIVICCITSHYLLSQLPDELKERIISLVDIIFIKTLELKKKQLLICSKGTQKLGIFQNHTLWQFAKDYIILPDERDQNLIHQMIYCLKVNGKIKECFPILDTFKAKYNMQSFIVGCTEIHLLSRYLDLTMNQQKQENIFLDPLTIFAQELGSISFLQKYADSELIHKSK